MQCSSLCTKLAAAVFWMRGQWVHYGGLFCGLIADNCHPQAFRLDCDSFSNARNYHVGHPPSPRSAPVDRPSVQ